MYIDALNDDKHSWELYVRKHFSGGIHAVAVRGEKSQLNGVDMFTIPFGAKQYRIKLDAKRLTEKVTATGIAELQKILKENNEIAAC